MKKFQLKFFRNRSLIRKIQLLSEFEKNDTYSLKSLATITQSSKRTLITDIQTLREFFKGSLAIHSTKFGYSIEEIDPDGYLKQKQLLVKDEPIFQLLESFFFNEKYSLLDWSLALNLSEQALLNYFRRINTYLAPFHLQIATNPVVLIGSEINVRQFFFVFYYESAINVNTLFPSIDVQNTVIEITRCWQDKTQLASAFSYFSYILYIAIERNKNDLQVHLSAELKNFYDQSKPFFQLESLHAIIERFFNCTFPEEEIIFLFICLICRQKINQPALLTSELVCEQWPEIKQLAHDFYKENRGSSFDESKDLVWLESFFIRLKLRELLSPTMNVAIDDLTQFVKEKFTDEYQKNQFFLSHHELVKRFYDPTYLDDICVSLTLHMEAIKEENWGRQRTIAIIFEGNEYACEYAESIIRKYLAPFHTLYYPDAGELSPEYLQEKNIDLLVTNYSEYTTEFLLEVECVLLKSFPDATDWNRLLKQINPRILRLVVLDNV